MARSVGVKNKKPIGLDLSKKKIKEPEEMPITEPAALMPQPSADSSGMPVPDPLANDDPLAKEQPAAQLNKQIPIDPIYEKRIRELENELAIVRGRVATSTVDNLDKLMKNPTFGTSSYIMISIGKDERTKKDIMAAISVFPDLVDPNNIDIRTKRPKLLAPDQGISRLNADVLRADESTMIEIMLVEDFVTGEEALYRLSIKTAVKKKREEYLRKRLIGDQMHMKQLLMVR